MTPGRSAIRSGGSSKSKSETRMSQGPEQLTAQAPTPGMARTPPLTRAGALGLLAVVHGLEQAEAGHDLVHGFVGHVDPDLVGGLEGLALGDEGGALPCRGRPLAPLASISTVLTAITSMAPSSTRMLTVFVGSPQSIHSVAWAGSAMAARRRTAAGSAFMSLGVGCDLHLGDLVGLAHGFAALDAVDDVHAVRHLAPHRVLAVEEGGVAEADEELAVGRVRVLRAGHGADAAHMRLPREFLLQVRLLGAAHAGAGRG